MKIGILTHFHKSTNYGGVLQAYALCKYLNDHGHCAKQILYNQSIKRMGESQVGLKIIFFKLRSIIRNRVHRNKNAQIRTRMESLFYEFRNSVPHTDNEYTKVNIGEVDDYFDAFIVGSDQVWNPMWYDSSYMLDFVSDKAKKISYAASLGLSNLNDYQKNLLKKMISDFKSISVREQAAQDIISAIVDKEVQLSVDPTLLLSVEEWDDVATERKIKDEYVFAYFLGDGYKERKIASNFAKMQGLKLVFIPDLLGKYRFVDRRIEAERITDATPNDFVSLIKYANYVFTDSFHACVFSILYNKQFLVFPRNGTIEMGSRIENLVSMFGCKDRFVVNKDRIKNDTICSIINAKQTGECRDFLLIKQKSIDYLETIK